MTVAELADALDEKPVAIIKMLMTDLGVMASMTQSLDVATCIAVAQGFGKIVADVDESELEGYVRKSLTRLTLSYSHLKAPLQGR
jgi:hypothetical protein